MHRQPRHRLTRPRGHRPVRIAGHVVRRGAGLQHVDIVEVVAFSGSILDVEPDFGVGGTAGDVVAVGDHGFGQRNVAADLRERGAVGSVVELQHRAVAAPTGRIEQHVGVSAVAGQVHGRRDQHAPDRTGPQLGPALGSCRIHLFPGPPRCAGIAVQSRRDIGAFGRGEADEILPEIGGGAAGHAERGAGADVDLVAGGAVGGGPARDKGGVVGGGGRDARGRGRAGRGVAGGRGGLAVVDALVRAAVGHGAGIGEDFHVVGIARSQVAHRHRRAAAGMHDVAAAERCGAEGGIPRVDRAVNGIIHRRVACSHHHDGAVGVGARRPRNPHAGGGDVVDDDAAGLARLGVEAAVRRVRRARRACRVAAIVVLRALAESRPPFRENARAGPPLRFRVAGRARRGAPHRAARRQRRRAAQARHVGPQRRCGLCDGRRRWRGHRRQCDDRLGAAGPRRTGLVARREGQVAGGDGIDTDRAPRRRRGRDVRRDEKVAGRPRVDRLRQARERLRAGRGRSSNGAQSGVARVQGRVGRIPQLQVRDVRRLVAPRRREGDGVQGSLPGRHRQAEPVQDVGRRAVRYVRRRYLGAVVRQGNIRRRGRGRRGGRHARGIVAPVLRVELVVVGRPGRQARVVEACRVAAVDHRVAPNDIIGIVGCARRRRRERTVCAADDQHRVVLCVLGPGQVDLAGARRCRRLAAGIIQRADREVADGRQRAARGLLPILVRVIHATPRGEPSRVVPIPRRGELVFVRLGFPHAILGAVHAGPFPRPPRPARTARALPQAVFDRIARGVLVERKLVDVLHLVAEIIRVERRAAVVQRVIVGPTRRRGRPVGRRAVGRGGVGPVASRD